ncbi:hypothetical protein [Phenylobacterium sp.]|jgi:hypothetical protein|uniref:hypothetical protein n=1 Tax=Phenylobacterium sp. TaxID=1871053 RepID=UPI002F4295F4
MTGKRSAAEVWRALWGGAEDCGEADDGPPPSPAEFQAFLAAASRLPPDKLQLLISAVRAAAPSAAPRGR